MSPSVIVLIVFLLTCWYAAAQNTLGPAAISKTMSNLFVSWTGIGTLQSSPIPAGPWQDILEAHSPFGTLPTNAQQFFRTTQAYSQFGLSKTWANKPDAANHAIASGLNSRGHRRGVGEPTLGHYGARRQ